MSNRTARNQPAERFIHPFLFISFPAGWATRPVAQDDQKVAQDAFPLAQDDEKYLQDGFPLRRTVKSIRRTASPCAGRLPLAQDGEKLSRAANSVCFGSLQPD